MIDMSIIMMHKQREINQRPIMDMNGCERRWIGQRPARKILGQAILIRSSELISSAAGAVSARSPDQSAARCGLPYVFLRFW